MSMAKVLTVLFLLLFVPIFSFSGKRGKRVAAEEERKNIDLDLAWGVFQTKVNLDFERSCAGCRKGNLGVAVEVLIFLSDDFVTINALVLNKDGGARLWEVYHLSREGFEAQQLDNEAGIAARRLKVFCRKAADWAEQGLLRLSPKEEISAAPSKKK